MKKHKVNSITKASYALAKTIVHLITKIRLLILLLLALLCILKGDTCFGNGMQSRSSWESEPANEPIGILILEITLTNPVENDQNLFFSLDPNWSCDPNPISYQYSIQTIGNTLVLEVNFGTNGVSCGSGRFGTISGLDPDLEAFGTNCMVASDGGLLIIESVDAF